jgi:sigma-E factor negative regulatory protein RseB
MEHDFASVLQPDDSVWVVRQMPPGFVQILDARRMLPGKRAPVRQMVYSDGLAAVSVFIEPLAEVDKPMQGLSAQGAINIYVKPVAEYQVTVLGEVPAATAVQIGNSVSHVPGGKKK